MGGIFYLNKHGITQSDIAKTVGLPKSTVQSIITRIKQTGSPLPGKPLGVPKEIDRRTQRLMQRLMKRNQPVTNNDQNSELEKVDINVCRATDISPLKERDG